MIPTILTDTGSGNSTRNAPQSPQPDVDAAQVFGDVFALAEPDGTDTVARDGSLVEAVQDLVLTGADDLRLSQSLITSPAPIAPGAHPLPQIASHMKPAGLAVDQAPLQQHPDAKAAVSLSETPEMPIEKAAVPRSSIAQSVIEGRLPPVAPRAATAQVDLPKPVPDAPPGIELSKAAVSVAPVPHAAPTAPLPLQAALPQRSLVELHLAKPEGEKRGKDWQVQDSQTRHSHVTSAPATIPLADVAFNAQPLSVLTGKQMTQAETLKNAIDGASLIGPGVAERGHAPQITATAPSVPMAPETARSVAQQIAVSVLNSPGKTTEIALNPEELGRVRLSLTATDGLITLTVLADRPETQDLLRRHLDVLAQEFRDLGYKSISFSFGRDGQSGARSDHDQHGQDTIADTTVMDTPATRPQLGPISGLDLRI